jgi:hypothetical protein
LAIIGELPPRAPNVWAISGHPQVAVLRAYSAGPRANE